MKTIILLLIGFALSIISLVINLYLENYGYTVIFLCVALLFMYLIEKIKIKL